ncbi:Uncharacterized protein AB751O23_AA_00090 [Chlamydiales bacterium SCGC AB-751-O23]|jgi:uncharacterized protein|nr:Uncharacterized protein AB751O23_AA_00090 [Chlamydiales bacterium SCGC AB-751-O23]
MTTTATICWFNIPSKDIERTKTFYTTLLDWKFQNFDASNREGGYWMVMEGDNPTGGISLMTPEETNSSNTGNTGPVMYFPTSESIGSIAKKALNLGASIVQEKVAIAGDGGFYIHIKDSEGNIIGLWSQSE